jgi:hypothetical protein
MYHIWPVLKTIAGEDAVLRSGDILGKPGTMHRVVFVGSMELEGQNVVDPTKGQAARLIHLHSIPNWQELRIFARGPEDGFAQAQVRERAWEVVTKGVKNYTLVSNCEHICSYIRTGEPESPQLKFWVGVAAAAAIVGWGLSGE